MSVIEKKIEKYNNFWKRENEKPLVGFSRGNYFVSKRFNAIENLLKDGKEINPNMIDVKSFKEDYLRMMKSWEKNKHDIFYTATPFPGFPWLEAMMGAKVFATKNSFVSYSKHYKGISELKLDKIVNNTWLEKYLEFCQMLNELTNNKNPVGQPILRGPTDVLGALVGQDKLVFHFIDNPSETTDCLDKIAIIFIEVIHKQYEIIKNFYNGFSMGFYDLWCPAKCMWFQDDLNALLSPSIYKSCIMKSHKYLSKAYEYTMFHMHPASNYMLDYLLEIKELNAIQINVDIGGPSVKEMVPMFKKVLKKKNLVIWGDFKEEEIDLLRISLNPQGLYIIIFKE